MLPRERGGRRKGREKEGEGEEGEEGEKGEGRREGLNIISYYY